MASSTVPHRPKVLFWINKDATSNSVSNSSREQRSAIQSQIQRGRPRKRKSKKDQPDEAIDSICRTPASDRVLQERPKELYDATTRGIAAPIDPFDTASIQIDTTAHGLLRYYVHYYHPAQWPNEPFSRDKGPYSYKASVHRIVTTAMQDQLMMFCLLSAACARIQHIDRLDFPTVARKQDGYTQKAIQLMREKVGEMERHRQRDEQTLHMLLHCMLFLGMHYVYGDDFEAGRIHLQVSLALLDQIGGINGLKDRHLQEKILMSDLFLACVDMQPCLCGWEYDPGPASVLKLQDRELRQLSAEDEFMGSALLGKGDDVLPADLQELIEQIIEIYHVKIRLQRSTISCTRALQTGQWITRRNMALRARLLDLKLDDDRMHALRIVSIMWTLLSMNITGRLKTVKIMAGKLRNVLARIAPEQWMPMENVRLWILLIGYTCSPQDSELMEWYFEQIRENEMAQMSVLEELAYNVSLIDWLEEFQKGFLYHGLVQRPVTLDLARKLLEVEKNSWT
ncbi:hypothetical protein M409DRAFT_57822 [Zasmidium cellare ATCC 36951]|uniref:Transcription factor domain-containing protein n=1 Tax=Zasmidium cellare ATCC 36951 TaxID=1080233 RepID=A0A6A6CBW4_ZASCE|nr:uncharacterized protein M409DRAFT_57822 [Zasmidium cellare ATCC 36951]KAF2163159.1 hypothetical protein M409DRAFT_57822 [Zasmidium cellare ATCC 36951]